MASDYKFDWPIRKNSKNEYNIKGNKILATCFATDFFCRKRMNEVKKRGL